MSDRQPVVLQGSMTISIAFGNLSEPIEKQLRFSNGMQADPADIDRWQDDADAIAQLSANGVLTPSETVCARKRLVKAIAAGVQSYYAEWGTRNAQEVP